MKTITNFFKKLNSILFLNYKTDNNESIIIENDDSDNIFYKEDIKVKKLLSTIGFWTKYIQSQKIDLINILLLNQDEKLGYYQNLVKAQYLLSKKKFNNHQNLC